MEIIPTLIIIFVYVLAIAAAVVGFGALYWFLCGDIIMRKMRISKAKSRE